MQLPKNRVIMAGVVILTFAISLIAYPFLPDQVASHWGLSGEANGYLPKAWGLFILPLLSAGLALLFLLIPRIDPLRENIGKFRATYDGFAIVVLLFLLYLSFLTIAWNLGIRFGIAQLLSPAFGVLYYACGILVGRARRNWFIGIRTPWTLSSERVWDRTHAIGGRLFRIAGILALPGTVLPGAAWLLILGPVLLISVYLVAFSYFEYQKEEMRESGSGRA